MSVSLVAFIGFRWVKPAASLKHGKWRLANDDINGTFPLGKTGGLIEALARWRCRWTRWCFRWVKPAASLKPGAADVATLFGVVSAG